MKNASTWFWVFLVDSGESRACRRAHCNPCPILRSAQAGSFGILQNFVCLGGQFSGVPDRPNFSDRRRPSGFVSFTPTSCTERPTTIRCWPPRIYCTRTNTRRWARHDRPRFRHRFIAPSPARILSTHNTPWNSPSASGGRGD